MTGDRYTLAEIRDRAIELGADDLAERCDIYIAAQDSSHRPNLSSLPRTPGAAHLPAASGHPRCGAP